MNSGCPPSPPPTAAALQSGKGAGFPHRKAWAFSPIEGGACQTVSQWQGNDGLGGSGARQSSSRGKPSRAYQGAMVLIRHLGVTV